VLAACLAALPLLVAAPDAETSVEPSAPALLAVDLELRPRVSVGLGYDANAKRVPFVVPESLADGGEETLAPQVVGDAVLLANAGLLATLRFDDWWLSADGAVGTKLFSDVGRPDVEDPGEYLRLRQGTRTDTERMLVAQSTVSASRPLLWGLVAQLQSTAKARGQASGSRSYGFTRTDALVFRRLPFGFSARGGLTGQFFHSFDLPFFSSFAGGALAGVSFDLTRRERFDASVEGSVRAFPFAPPVPAPADPQVRRLDEPVRLSLRFTSRRRIYLNAGYDLMRNFSSSRGESWTRHRIVGMAGFRLPMAITATLRGTLQLTQYDDGVSVSQQLFLQEDDESRNSVQMALSRPWIGGLHLDGRLAWYGNELAKGGARFSRTTATMGVRAELW
jgi:hypothetical protein